MRRIEVICPAARDPKKETKSYTLPDPKNWDEFYAHSNHELLRTSQDQGALKTFMGLKVPHLNKCIELERGGEGKILEVSEHYFSFVKNDRNVFVRDLGPVHEEPKPVAAAVADEKSTKAKTKRSRKAA